MFKWPRRTFEIRGWTLKICKNFEITRTICWNSERSEQFLVIEYFFNLFLEVSHIYSEQLEFKLENWDLKIWQKYMLILKKYCSVLQIKESTKKIVYNTLNRFSVCSSTIREKNEQNRTQNFQKFRLSNTRMYFLEKL